MARAEKSLRADGVETRARLKAAAQRLFAERGIDGVTTQDIITAAGQRNSASLRYYFGGKTELARELVVDGARLLDERRQTMLDELEARAEPPVLRDFLMVLNVPVLDLASVPGQTSYVQMIANFQANHRTFLREALGDRWNAAYKCCLERLTQLLPDIPQPILQQRISLSGIYANAVWAAREKEMSEDVPSQLWSEPFTVSNVIDTLQMMLEAPPSEFTTALLAAEGVSATDAVAGPGPHP